MTDHELIIDLQKRVEALEARLAQPGADLPDSSGINFGLNPNAFVSRYAHKGSGKEKFTWLVAYLAKGDETAEIAMKDIESLWNRMTAKTLLGSKFNRKYTNEAKTKGWVDSPKKGHYRLAAGWVEVYQEEQS